MQNDDTIEYANGKFLNQEIEFIVDLGPQIEIVVNIVLEQNSRPALQLRPTHDHQSQICHGNFVPIFTKPYN